jgi:hypothetical protein
MFDNAGDVLVLNKAPLAPWRELKPHIRNGQVMAEI